MKNRKRKQQAKAAARSRRISLIIVAVAVVVVAAITVVSKQLVKGKATSLPESKAVTKETGKKYVTVKVAGRDVQVDSQTGQIKPLSPEEAKQMADGLKTMLNKSTDGLVHVQQTDGSVSMDLQGRFQNVAVARVNADGTLEQSCVDEPLAAAQFFGIDPQLLGIQVPKGAANQPVVRTAAKKVSQ
jgi:hypothetical protein